MRVGAAESLKLASLRSCDDDVHALDVFDGVNGGEDSEANLFGKEKAGKMAVFGNGSIKCVNDYEWYDSESGDIGIELGECEQGGVLEFEICACDSYGTKGSSNVIQL